MGVTRVFECTFIAYDVRVLMTMWAKDMAFNAQCWVGDFAVPGWEGSMGSPGSSRIFAKHGQVDGNKLGYIGFGVSSWGM